MNKPLDPTTLVPQKRIVSTKEAVVDAFLSLRKDSRQAFADAVMRYYPDLATELFRMWESETIDAANADLQYGLEVIVAARSRWNAAADAWNQWDALGLDEKVELCEAELQRMRDTTADLVHLVHTRSVT